MLAYTIVKRDDGIAVYACYLYISMLLMQFCYPFSVWARPICFLSMSLMLLLIELVFLLLPNVATPPNGIKVHDDDDY